LSSFGLVSIRTEIISIMPVSMNKTSVKNSQFVRQAPVGKRPVAVKKKPKTSNIMNSAIFDPTPVFSEWTGHHDESEDWLDCFNNAVQDSSNNNDEHLNTPPLMSEDSEEYVQQPDSIDMEWDLMTELNNQAENQEKLFHDYYCISPLELEGRTTTATTSTTTTAATSEEAVVKLETVVPVVEEIFLPVPDQDDLMMLNNVPEPSNNNISFSEDKDDIWGQDIIFKDLDSALNAPGINDILAYVCTETGVAEAAEDEKEAVGGDHNVVKEEVEKMTLVDMSNVQIEVLEETPAPVIRSRRTRKPRKEFSDALNSVVAGGVSKKKNVGRPRKTEPITITKITETMKKNLAGEQLESLKYRRMRDLNNQASRRCREARKNKAALAELELRQQEERNTELKMKYEMMKKQYDTLKKQFQNLGLHQ